MFVQNHLMGQACYGKSAVESRCLHILPEQLKRQRYKLLEVLHKGGKGGARSFILLKPGL